MKTIRRLLALAASAVTLAAGLMVATAPAASAAESIPPLQYPAVNVGRYENTVPGASGSITLPCNDLNGGNDLRTYSGTGALIRQLDRTQFVDGVTNCIQYPVVDKNDTLYGITNGKTPSGSYATGQYLYAYAGNALKWKYPLACGSGGPRYVVGATGNIYATASLSDGMHIIGIAPELESGQTQPAKVFDVKVPNSCNSVELYAYRDGIMLRAWSGNSRFYSYGGQLLAQPSSSQFWDLKLNAAGQLIHYNYVTGSYKSVNVSMYDPLTDQTIWTTSASTPGANVDNLAVIPVSTGGAVALIREQKMASPGVPVTPTEYIENLVPITSAGQKGTPVTLPKSTPQGVFGQTFLAPISDGKVAVVRDMQMNTGLSWPTTVPAVSVAVYDPVTNSWPYQDLIAGDLNKPGGPYGYAVQASAYDKAFWPSANALNLLVRCVGNCGSIGRKLLPVTVTGSGADYPRSTVLATPILKPLAALGDSYSSGDGVPKFANGTDIPGTNECHRSHYAYPRLLAGNMASDLTLADGGFYACGGAETKNILNTSQYNEPAQSTRLNGSTEVVTLTIGGNDIGFTAFGTACVVDSCNFDSAAYADASYKIDNVLPANLENTYKKVLEKAPNAEIFVVGYPQVAPIKTAADPDDIRCSYLYHSGYDPTGTIPQYWEDAQAARDIVSRLNSKIAVKVTAVRQLSPDNLRLHYVEVNGTTSPFAGHTVCAAPGDSYFNNLDQWVGHPAYALHPNQRGQQAYAELVEAEIAAN